MDLLKQIITESTKVPWVYTNIWPQLSRYFYYDCMNIVEQPGYNKHILPTEIKTYTLPKMSRMVTEFLRNHYKEKGMWAKNIKFKFSLFDNVYYKGRFAATDDIELLLGDKFLNKIISTLYEEKDDDEIDGKSNFLKNIRPILEGLVHEIAHLEQITTNNNDISKERVYKTKVSSMNNKIKRGDYPDKDTREKLGPTLDYARYVGFSDEADSMAAATATSLIDEFKGDVIKALHFLRTHTHDVRFISNQFNSVYMGLLKNYQDQPEQFKKAWRHFLTTVYKQVQTHSK